MISDQRIHSTKEFLVYPTMLPTTSLSKNILGSIILDMREKDHSLVIPNLEQDNTREDLKTALIGLMPNETYDKFEDLDSDVFVYEELLFNGKSYNFVSEEISQEILETLQKKPELTIKLIVSPSRSQHANTILRALLTTKELQSGNTTELINNLISLNKLY